MRSKQRSWSKVLAVRSWGPPAHTLGLAEPTVARRQAGPGRHLPLDLSWRPPSPLCQIATAIWIAGERKGNTHVCVHTETRTHTNGPPHAEVDAHLYTDVSTHRDMYMLAHAGTHAHRQACTQRPGYPDARVYTHERVPMFVHRCACTRAFMYIRVHTCTYMCTCTHTQT